MDINELETSWVERGISFGIGTIKANDGIKDASHEDKDELVLMECGKHEFTIDGKTFTQEGNIEVLIPAGAIHSIKKALSALRLCPKITSRYRAAMLFVFKPQQGMHSSVMQLLLEH